MAGIGMGVWKDRPMAQFAGLIPLLDPYRSEDNEHRARRVSSPSRTVRSHATADGLSIVVLHKERPDLLRRLWLGFSRVREVMQREGIECELLLGDTGSVDAETIGLLDAPPVGVTVFRGLEYQFSRCNNDLFERARCRTILFMNNDVYVDERPEGVLDAYRFLHGSPLVGAVGVVLLFEDGTVQHAGVDLLRGDDVFGLPFHPSTRSTWSYPIGEVIDSPAVTGAFLMTHDDLFARAGGFDEQFAIECQDVDLCLRLRRADYDIRTVAVGPIYHVENATRESGEENWRDRALFIRRWSSYAECL